MSPYWLMPLVLLSTAATSAFADVETRITAINGDYYQARQTQLNVQPGDTISLTADQVDVDYSGQENALQKYAEDFQWSSDAQTSTGSGDVCDLQYDCAGTNFEGNSYGVTFYVPYDMGQYLTLTVQNKTDGTYDQLTLINTAYTQNDGNGGGYQPPTDSYDNPYDYPENDSFDYNRGLAGHGRWVYISGVRTFVPYSYQNDWQPYQNGYWYWTEYGWAWYSYDPWGWVTDHYGYWRNHETYGWVWFPFERPSWHPAVVTFFYNNDGIGWSPYYHGYSRGYSHGYDHGYRDGYWDGYNAGLNDRYRWGGTYVSYNNFCGHGTQINIYNVRVRDANVYYRNAYQAGNYNVHIRDHRYGTIRESVSRYHPVYATPVTVRNQRYGRGNVMVVAPRDRVSVPANYRDAGRASRDRVVNRQPVPIGSRPRQGGGYERPRAPVVVAPRVPDGRGGRVTMPPRTRQPVETPRPVNPNPRPERPSLPPRRPTPERPRPTPERPIPTPERPRPTPERPRPTPQPERPAPTPERPRPAPTPERPRPAPERPTPQPERPRPAPERPAPQPERPRPTPERPRPTPQPERPAPAPERPRPTPMPERPAPQPERPRPAPQPERPRPAPERPAPQPERPRPAPERPRPAPERPSRPAPAPERPSRPERPAPSPSPSPAPAPSRPSPSRPKRPAPQGTAGMAADVIDDASAE